MIDRSGDRRHDAEPKFQKKLQRHQVRSTYLVCRPRNTLDSHAGSGTKTLVGQRARHTLENLRVPYTQQFAPEQTPLRRLFPIIRQNLGDSAPLKKAIGSAFFKHTKTPEKMAGNTLIALKFYGVLDGNCQLTDFGKRLLDSKDVKAAHEMIAKRILLELNCLGLVETLREMKSAGSKFRLVDVTAELRKRGFEVSDNSSDLSGVLNWLREAGVLKDYNVDEGKYAELVGASTKTIVALKGLNVAQISFLRAMVALGIKTWTPHNQIVAHAETLYTGEAFYNWKDIDRMILQPLVKEGLIEVQKRPKSREGARGGKAAEVKPTGKFEKEISEPILAPMYKSAGFSKVREIASLSLSDVITQVRQGADLDKRARALEILAVKICQLLDLDFMGLRETDESVVAGGEVDAFMQSARLVYSRWQIQCKASDRITYEAIAKEVGVAEVSLATVILIVSTGKMTEGADTYRKRIISKGPLNIAIIDGESLEQIARNPVNIGPILVAQADEAMQIKAKPKVIFRGGGSSGGGSEGVAKVAPANAVEPASTAAIVGDEPFTLTKPACCTLIAFTNPVYFGPRHA
jgi:hypothetical protein